MSDAAPRRDRATHGRAPADRLRYDRQMRLPGIGQTGQQRLAASRVAVLGCGALGTVAAEILARAGVGQLRVIDRDVVEWTNLQRQALFYESDAAQGLAKAEVVCQRLALINSQVVCQPEVCDVTADNIQRLLADADLVIDATDNFAIRLLLNDYSLKHHIAWVHGGCVGTSGQTMFFNGQGKPCFRCLVPELPPASSVDTCDTVGVLGSATHAIASLQATEALKWLSGNRQAVRSSLWAIDFWNSRHRQIELPETTSADCPACQEHRYDFLESAQRGSGGDAAVVCGRNSVQLPAVAAVAGHGDSPQPLDLQRLADRWSGLGQVQQSRFFVRLSLDQGAVITVFRDGRTLVDGTSDIARARTLAAQFVGS